MAARKFAISMPAEVMKLIDGAAADRGITRSRFIADVLRKAAQARSDAAITRQLNAVFADDESVDREQRSTARALQRAGTTRGTEW